jgi:hypothetical protein
MKSWDIINIVSNLNNEIYEQIENNEMNYLDYLTDGYVEIIEFIGYPIWNSEDDNRKWINDHEREDLETYLRNEITNLIQKLNTINLLI